MLGDGGQHPVAHFCPRHMMKMLRMSLLLAGAVASASCGEPDPAHFNGIPGRELSVEFGGRIDLQFQNIGPGEYVSPPTLEGNALRFIDEIPAPGVVVPAGPTQLFR